MDGCMGVSGLLRSRSLLVWLGYVTVMLLLALILYRLLTLLMPVPSGWSSEGEWVPVNALLLNDEEGERKQDEALASGDASARSKDSLDGTKEPAQEQAESAEERREVASEESAASGDALIPINSADLEQLQKLPGIGPAKAQAILDYRREHGPFRSPEELLNVKGIGQKTLEKMLPYLKLE